MIKLSNQYKKNQTNPYNQQEIDYYNVQPSTSQQVDSENDAKNTTELRVRELTLTQ